MHPYLFRDVDAYPVFVAVAVLGAGSVALRSFRRVGMSARSCWLMLLSLAIGGLLGAKGYSGFEDPGGFRSLVDLTHGYRYPGAIIGCAAVLILFGTRLSREVPLAAVGDALVPAVGVGAALLRFGCFMAGCCFGRPSTLPWAVPFPKYSPAWLAQVGLGLVSPKAATSLPVHPLQLYFMIVSLAATTVALRLEPRKTYTGQVILAFLAVDQLAKFGLEFLRQEPLPGVQLASLVIGLTAAATLAVTAWYRRAHRTKYRSDRVAPCAFGPVS